MRRLLTYIPWVFFLFGTLLYLLVMPHAVTERERHEQLFALPPQFLKLMSFQFKESVADISFLNALVFLGGTLTQSDTHQYLPQQYEWVHNTLKNSAALDPYFLDPYNLMNSALIWDRYKLDEVNNLIALGADTRDWDSLLPYYAGFNYYYFLDNPDKSFTYLTMASKRSNGNPFYVSLASRVAYKANKSELAIAYLEEQIYRAGQEGWGDKVDPLKARLDVLKGIRQIEVALESYRKLFGKLPGSVNELKAVGILPSIPVIPFGGKFFIDDKGRVRTDKF